MPNGQTKPTARKTSVGSTEFNQRQLEQIKQNLTAYAQELGLSRTKAEQSANIFVEELASRSKEKSS